MAAPWEKYAKQGTSDSGAGPWAKYGTAPATPEADPNQIQTPPLTMPTVAPQVIEPAAAPPADAPNHWDEAEQRVIRRTRRSKVQDLTEDERNAVRAEAGDELRQIAKGATFNMAPRMEAVVRAAGDAARGDGWTYSDNLDRINQENKAFEEAHPVKAGVLQVAGGLPVAIPGATAINAGVKGLVNGRSAAGAANAGLAGTAAGMAAVGGAGGALTGAGNAEDWSDPAGTAGSIGKEAAIGAVAAPVIGGTAYGAWRAAKGAANVVRNAPYMRNDADWVTGTLLIRRRGARLPT